jgi:hypothetical protein
LVFVGEIWYFERADLLQNQHELLSISSLTIHYYLTGRTNISSDFDSVSTNSADYISNVLGVNSAISKCINEMVNEKSKVVFSYTSVMVDITIETRLSLDGRFQQLSFFLPFDFNFSISVLLHILRIAWFHQVL